MEVREIKEILLNELTKEQKYLLNTKQAGEAGELLNSLERKDKKRTFEEKYFINTSIKNLKYSIMKVQEYLDEKYPQGQRKEITKINISGWIDDAGKWEAKSDWEKLTGGLDLSSFPNLERLDCSFNKITSLNLTSCSKLTELKCWDNQLKEIVFTNLSNLKIFYAWTNLLTNLNWSGLNPQRLTCLSLSNNNFTSQDLAIFSKFTNLKELYLGNDIEVRISLEIVNRFFGSLSSLKNLTKLEKLQIENTDIDEDPSSLPENLQIIYWGREIIIKKLKLTEIEKKKLQRASKEDFSKILKEIVTNYAKNELGTDLNPNQVEKINEISNSLAISSIKLGKVELESNFVNLEKVLSEIVKNSSQKIIEELKNNALIGKLDSVQKNIDEFVNNWVKNDPTSLKNSKQLKRYDWAIWFSQWGGRLLAAVGGGLALNDNYNQIGGAIGVVYPVIDAFISFLKDKNDENKKKLETFDQDVARLGDNYVELIKILEPIKDSASEKLSGKLQELNNKIYNFLAECDENDDGEVTVQEIVANKDQLPTVLKNNWEGQTGKRNKLHQVAFAIERLKNELNDCQKINVSESRGTLLNQSQLTLNASEDSFVIEETITEQKLEAKIKISPTPSNSGQY